MLQSKKTKFYLLIQVEQNLITDLNDIKIKDNEYMELTTSHDN